MSVRAPTKKYSPTIMDSGHGLHGWIRKKAYNRFEERSPRLEDLITKNSITTKSGVVNFADTSPAPTGVTQANWKSKYPYWQEALDMFVMRRCINYLTLQQKCTTESFISIETSVQADLGNIEYIIYTNITGEIVSNGILDHSITWIMDSIEVNDEGNGFSTANITFKTYGLWESVQIYQV